MKRIIFLVACSLLTSFAFAAVPGAYVGIGGGYGNLRTPKGYAFSSTDPTINSNTRWGGGWGTGRAFIGFNFNRYIGLESGWAYYPRTIYKASDIFGDTASLKYNAKAVDAVIKAYLPIGFTGASVYAVLGAAYVTETITYSNNGIANEPTMAAPDIGKTNYYKTRPLYGVGASYDFPCHITTSVEFTQIQRLGTFANNGQSIPFMNLATFNIIYRLN